MKSVEKSGNPSIIFVIIFAITFKQIIVFFNNLSIAIPTYTVMIDKDCDITVILGVVVVFALPVTVLVPGFSVWDVVPKVRISRLHVFSQDLTWPQLNAAIILLLMLFFCLYLEIRKRKLDDMVEKVLTVSQATDSTMEVERDRQANAVRVCVDLLDASTEHYENLVLLRDELRKREKLKKQHPPEIVPSSASSYQ